MDEPIKMYSLIRDSDGDIWRRGRTRWTCIATDTRVPRLVWVDLSQMYGPIELVREGLTWRGQE